MKRKIKGYWICCECPKELGGIWTKDHIVIACKTRCETCNGEKQITKLISPYMDYDWLDPKFTDHFKANRD